MLNFKLFFTRADTKQNQRGGFLIFKNVFVGKLSGFFALALLLIYIYINRLAVFCEEEIFF